MEQLEEQVSTLTAKSEAAELEALRREADSQAAAPASEQSAEERSFTSGDRGLQMLNPELSVGSREPLKSAISKSSSLVPPLGAERRRFERAQVARRAHLRFPKFRTEQQNSPRPGSKTP